MVIMPDSFTPRGFPDGVCTNSQAQAAGPGVRASDAMNAAAYMRSLPEVDGARIGLLGGSHGGSTTLAALVRPGAGFAAAVSLYPGCGARYGAWSVRRQNGIRGPITGYAGVYAATAPLLILIGEKDDWTPAEPCRRMAETARQHGYPVEITVYPDAHHSFDSFRPVRYVKERSNVNAPDGRGATTGGNPEAWADAKKRVAGFFAKHLKAPQ
jgi:dienelactone hydrolase